MSAEKTRKSTKRRATAVDLRRFDAQDILKAVAIKEKRKTGPKIPQAVASALNQGNKKAREHCEVSVFLKSAQILNNQEGNLFGDLSGEVYAVSLAFDLTGEGAELDQASEVFNQVSRTASRPLIVSSSSLFANVRDNDSLPLLGNGIPLYGPKNPKGLLDLHLAIMEDDGGYRRLGAIVEKACEDLQVSDTLAKLVELSSLGAPEVFAARSLIKLLFYTVIAGLENSRDDVIQNVHFSSLAHQGYLPGAHPFDERGARGVLEVDVQWS